MNILIYYQNASHTVFLESLVQSFIEKGHRVFFLTTCEKGLLHEKVELLGARAFSYAPRQHRLLIYLMQWKYLIHFCRQHNIEVIYSHLQVVNLIAVFAQYFIKAKVFPCRHHSDDVRIHGNKNAILTDQLVNKRAKKLIVVSEAVKHQLIHFEKTPASKIKVIPLGYNFDLYDKPDLEKTKALQAKMNCQLLLIVIGRMTENKRHIVAIQVLHQLLQEGLDVKMLLLDRGEKEEELKEYVNKNKLADKILFTGFLNNTVDHMAAADLLLHPSISEASNQVVKEMAYLNKPSVVCKGVGDFEEYFVHGQNGWLVSKEKTMEEMVLLIKKYYHQKEALRTMGERMRKVVLERFDIHNVSEAYLNLSKTIE